MSIAAGGILSALHMREVIRHHFIGVLPELCAAGGGHRAPFSDCSSGELRPRRVPTVDRTKVGNPTDPGKERKESFVIRFVWICFLFLKNGLNP